MKQEYIVQALESRPLQVIMFLAKRRELPPEFVLPAGEPFVEISPAPKTDAERVISEQIDALKKFAPGLAQSLTGYPAPGGMAVGPAPIDTGLIVHLTPEEYVQMGSPPVLSVINLTITRSKLRWKVKP